jgi:tetratricopeptide (TPR) repeat protein
VTAGAVAVALVGLLALAPAAGAAPAREQALAALQGGDAEQRRWAARVLGEVGAMEDAAPLARALRDPDPLVRAFAEGAMWQVWSRSGDEEVDALFATGVEQMGQRKLQAAVATFTRVIERRPDFAEGWNKRATAYYLLGDYRRSLGDCGEVVKRNPEHWGALSGYGMIYLRLDQPGRALEFFERALAANPNLSQVRHTIEQLRALLLQRRRDSI